MHSKRRKSLYAINEESKHKFEKEIKQDTAMKASNAAKRRSPRAERSKKFTAVEKPEAKMPANLEKHSSKSISEEKEVVVACKKKLDKSNSAKVKRATVGADTKSTTVTKFTGTTYASNSTHTNSSNSAMTATVSALKEQPEHSNLQKRTAFGSTVVTNYGPTRKSIGRAGSGEYSLAQKPDNHIVAKARKACVQVESKVRPKTSKSVPKIGIEKENKQEIEKEEPA